MHVSLAGPRIYGEITAAQGWWRDTHCLPYAIRLLRGKTDTDKQGPRAPMRYTGFSLVESPGRDGWQRWPAGKGSEGVWVLADKGWMDGWDGGGSRASATSGITPGRRRAERREGGVGKIVEL